MSLDNHYQHVIANLKEVVFQTNIEGCITTLNPAWTNITGFSQQDGLGQTLWNFIHPEDQTQIQQQLQLLLLGQIPNYHCQARYFTRGQRLGWLDLFAYPAKDRNGRLVGIAGSFADITVHKAQERQLSIEQSVTDVLADSISLGEAFPKLLMAICQNLEWEYGELWMPQSPQAPPQCLESWHHSLNLGSKNLTYCNEQGEPLPTDEPLIFELGAGYIDQIWAGNGLAWLTKPLSESDRFSPAELASIQTAFSMPISDGSSHLGVMMFFKQTYQPIDESLLKQMGMIGKKIGDFVLRIQAEKRLRHQHQCLQSELKEAAAYMRSLLPQPMTTGVEISHQFVPSNQLGGDAFDYYWLDSDHLALYLLDVSGHGIRSTLLAVGVLNLLRNQSLLNADFYQPCSVLTSLNRTFQMKESGKDYFTIWYSVYNRVQQTLTYSSAGHPPTLLFSANADVQSLYSGGLPVGLLEEVTYPQKTCQIEPGSTLYLFSDGVYEISTVDGQRWQFEQFIELVKEYHQKRLHNLSKIFSEVIRIQGQPTLEDDYSLIQADFLT